jgi:hypothetical protein
MDSLERINPLLKVDVVRRELGLSFTPVLAIIPSQTAPQASQTLSSAWPNCSLVYWKVREAKGVICPPSELRASMSAFILEPFDRLMVLVMVESLREALLESLECVHLDCDVMINRSQSLVQEQCIDAHSRRLLSAKWSFVMQVPDCLCREAPSRRPPAHPCLIQCRPDTDWPRHNATPDRFHRVSCLDCRVSYT